jgi:hypothetical protein
MKSEKTMDKRRDRLRQEIKDPVRYAQLILGVTLWQAQNDILKSIQNNRKTAVKACHASGKTFALAVAALWWLARYKDGVVLTTGPTFRQVESQLWAEIHRLARGARTPYPELNKTELKLRGDTNYALGFSTSKAVNFQGFHGAHVLIIADEAPGIDAEIWNAVAGIRAGGDVHVVMAGNPTTPSGPFFDAFNRERSQWNCISIDAFDTPNLEGIDLNQLLPMEATSGGPLDQNRFPHLVSRRWVFEQYAVWWHGDERSSPQWMARVRGQFPDQANNALIRMPWLERARNRAIRNPVSDPGGPLIAGVDVGGGEAETVVYLCTTGPRRYSLIGFRAWRAEDTRGEVVQFLTPYRKRLTKVRVDGIGLGHNFGLHLRDLGFEVDLVKVGMPCESQPQLRDSDPADRFANQKAFFYQNLADAFERDEIEGLVDDVTFGQLADIRYELDSRGRLRVEPKEKARERGVSALDRAEALMLALGDGCRRNFPDWFMKEIAVTKYNDGKEIKEVADDLKAAEEEVKMWIKSNLARARRERTPWNICDFCGRYFKIGESKIRLCDLYRHIACESQFSSGAVSPLA